MALPDVCIAPYEAGGLAPDEPLCAPATYRVWVWSQYCGGYYLVRPIKLSTGWPVLVARHQKRSDAPLLQLERSEQDHISLSIFRGHFCRVLYFDADGHLASPKERIFMELLVSTPGCPNWGMGRRSRERFKWKGARPEGYLSARWRATTTATQIEQDVIEMLADPNSDCTFAWNWVQLNREERKALLLRTERESLEACENILRFALWTDPSWDNGTSCWFIDLRNEQSHCSTLDDVNDVVSRSYVECGLNSNALSPRQSRLLGLVLKHFGIHRNREVENRTLIPSVWNRPIPFWTFSVPIPTQHERLEARLQLREWLRDKVSPNELASLF